MAVAVLAAGVGLTTTALPADATSAVPSVSLISRRFSDGLAGNGSSSWASMSEDGRFVAFSSSASNLVADGQDTNQRGDIFVFDRSTATTSKITAGAQSSAAPAISPNGRYVAFSSAAPNLVPGDTNNKTDVFLYDRETSSTKRVSLSSQGEESNGHSDGPSVSSNGDVVFVSSGSNLVSSDGNSFDDIFLHRTSTGVTIRVSTSTSGGAPNNYSGEPRITGNGNFVTYYSVATNLVASDSNGRSDIFVWEASSGTTTLASLANGGGPANHNSYTPAITEDGRYVAFASLAGNLVSGDGNSYYDVFVRDRVAGVTTRISVSTSGASANTSSGGRTTISQDGRYVAFSSAAGNLVSGDTNLLSDVFVRDLQEGTTTRVSMSGAGQQIPSTSSGEMLSPDGRYVLFGTSAQLVAADQNPEADVYLYDRLGDPPSLTNLAPSDGAAVSTSTPTLSATYDDPNPGDDGHVEFEIYQDANLVASNTSAAVVQRGQTATWQVPEGILQGGRTYTWRSRAFDGVNYSPWTNHGARALVIGGTYPTVDQWNVDEDSGAVDYAFRVNAAGLNAPGDVAGPCYLSSCSWRVESRYSSGTVQKNFGVFASGTLDSGTASMNEAVSGALSVEATEIRTIIEPGSCSGCTQARTGYDSGWLKVRNPYRSGGISLTVNDFYRDVDTGVTAYDLGVSARGAAKVLGPCHEKGCQWRVEARYADGTTSYLSSGELPAGKWSFSRNVIGAVGAQITALKATLDSLCGVDLEYWCWERPWEVYETEWIDVSDSMHGDQDLVGYEIALAAALALDPSRFCDPLAVAGGALPSLDQYSPPDAYQRCLEAVQLYGPKIRKILLYIAAAAGGKLALDILLDEHAYEGPVPTPEEEATPAPPWNPPDNWEDNGCHWKSIQYTAESETHLITHGHIYEYRKPKKSWFYPWVTPNLKSLAEKHARFVMPEPDPINLENCRRVVTHLTRDVGIDERHTHEPTHVYTVITRKTDGEVVTMFPGEP